MAKLTAVKIIVVQWVARFFAKQCIANYKQAVSGVGVMGISIAEDTVCHSFKNSRHHYSCRTTTQQLVYLSLLVKINISYFGTSH